MTFANSGACVVGIPRYRELRDVIITTGVGLFYL
jgi:hypothetical protein